MLEAGYRERMLVTIAYSTYLEGGHIEDGEVLRWEAGHGEDVGESHWWHQRQNPKYTNLGIGSKVGYKRKAHSKNFKPSKKPKLRHLKNEN